VGEKELGRYGTARHHQPAISTISQVVSQGETIRYTVSLFYNSQEKHALL
jgi:hypothetical protein